MTSSAQALVLATPLKPLAELITEGWMAGASAEAIAANAGIPRSQVGTHVISLGLPARDHKLQPIEGSRVVPLCSLGLDYWIDSRRMGEELLQPEG